MHLIVFGSINMDLVTRTQRLPKAGETVAGKTFFTTPGGKGANQAVAAARLGAQTYLIGRVGSDRFGEELLTSLQTAGVQTAGVSVDPQIHSGVAAIALEETGENSIIVVAGANARVGAAEIEQLKTLLPEATALLLQLETPIDIVHKAAQVAREAGVLVILDPAPVPGNFPADLYPLIDIITPNEVEATQLTGIQVQDGETAIQAAAELRRRGVGSAIIKLGAKGACCVTPQETLFIPAFSLQTVDTVAAGDAFNGGLATALAAGLGLREALLWGSAAGALSATKAGAQAAMPDRVTLQTLLSNTQLRVRSRSPEN